MAEISVIKASEFSTSDFKYVAPKMNASGGKSIGILNSKSNKALYIETPAMLQWGIKDYEDNKKFDMSLQFPNPDYESNPATDAFLQNMIAFENKVKEDAITNAKEWFGKSMKLTPETVEVLFSSKIKYPKDKDTGEANGKPPTFSVRVPYYEGVWRTEVFDTNGQILFPNDSDSSLTPATIVAKGSKVITILQCGGIWFANGKFGVTWKLYQTVTKPVVSKKGRWLGSASEDLDSVVTNDDVDVIEDDEESSVPVPQLVQESDDEDEVVEEEATPSAPVVVEEPKKKKVVKKVVKKAVASEA